MQQNDRIVKEISSLLRARIPLIWVITREEQRVELSLAKASAQAGCVPHFWDAAQGPTELTGDKTPGSSEELRDAGIMLNLIGNKAKSGVTRDLWVMRDLTPWLDGLIGATPRRIMRNLARLLPTSPQSRSQAIIVLTTSSTIPEDLAGHVSVIDWPLPDRDEMKSVLDTAIKGLPEELRQAACPDAITYEQAIDAAVGLSEEEAANCYAKSLVSTRKVDPALVSREKKRVISREKILEWYDPIPGGLDAVGGLDNLKSWLKQRASAYSQEARDYGLPSPKGMFLAGVPGCGKSLTAKAVAATWSCPLLRLDLGALKSKFVGESEQNLRKAFRIIESCGRSVVWIDEIEKALSGATSGAADGGVSADALGAFLTWMQEKKSESFVVVTANDVSQLPPELMRKGRFDELWFVDLPTPQERVQILQTTFAFQYYATPTEENGIDFQRVAAVCEDFTGVEVTNIIPDAMFEAFSDDRRPLTTKDLLAAARRVTPLAKTASDKITALRKWAERARPASLTTREQASTLRTIDV